MKKFTKKIICVFCAVIIAVPFCIFGAAAENECCEYYPTVIIPGFLQSATHLYNDDGTLATDKKGNAYEDPFFLDTTGEIVWKAVKKLLCPLLSVLCRQTDVNNKFSKALAEVLGEILMEKIKCGENGDPVYNVDAEHYNCSFAECTKEEQEHILSCIPVQNLIDVIGEDHLYFYSYNSLGNLDDATQGLYDMIQLVKEETGHDKVNIVPISQGGSLCNNLLEYYPQVMDDLHRIVYVIPALDGTELISDIFTNGINDDDDALYGYMMPSLLGEETGALVNILLRFLPKSVLNGALDYAVDYLIENYIKNITCLWGFVKTDDYEYLADKYLSGEENAEIRRQTDAYQQARINSDKNILTAVDKGIEVFDIVNYNTPLYTICGAWDEVNADGIIDVDSTSMGAYSLGVDKTLPDGYVQQGNSCGTCSDPEHHNHIDPHNIIDASTGLLPDNTFYYYNGNHEKTSQDDALIALVIRLLIDENIKDVYSCPDEFPQFNTSRVSRSLRNDIAAAKELLPSLGGADSQALSAVIEEAEAMLAETKVDLEKTEQAKNDFYEVYNRVTGKKEEKESFFSRIFSKAVVKKAENVEKKYGYNSFSGK